MTVVHASDLIWAFCAFVGVILLTHSPWWAFGVGALICWASAELHDGGRG